MKKLLFLLLSLSTLLPARALVTFKFERGSSTSVSASLAAKMESNMSALLTEIDNAYTGNRPLRLTPSMFTSQADEMLMNAWKVYHYRPLSDVVTAKLVHDVQGFQVRGISVRVQEDASNYRGSLRRELNVSFSRSGLISGVRLADSSELSPSEFLKEAAGVTDERRRMEILKFTEDFRNYYIEGNADALEAIFSEDAIIITGSVYTRQKTNKDGMFHDQTNVKYTQQTPKEYCGKLRRRFANGEKIRVTFDNIGISTLESNPNIYGVTLRQVWKSSTGYSDVGWLFLMWDFSNPEAPRIHVRTWQPQEMIGSQDQVLGLPDFYVEGTKR